MWSPDLAEKVNHNLLSTILFTFVIRLINENLTTLVPERAIHLYSHGLTMLAESQVKYFFLDIDKHCIDNGKNDSH